MNPLITNQYKSPLNLHIPPPNLHMPLPKLHIPPPNLHMPLPNLHLFTLFTKHLYNASLRYLLRGALCAGLCDVTCPDQQISSINQQNCICYEGEQPIVMQYPGRDNYPKSGHSSRPVK